MDKLTELFKNNLVRAFKRADQTKLAVATAAKLSRTQLDRYLDEADETSPTLETVARIAGAIGVEPWALTSNEPGGPDVQALAEMLASRERRIKELEAQLQKTGEKLQKDGHLVPAEQVEESPKKDELFEALIVVWSRLDKEERASIVRTANALLYRESSAQAPDPVAKPKKSGA